MYDVFATGRLIDHWLIEDIGAWSTDRTISLIGVTWVTTTTVLPG